MHDSEIQLAVATILKKHKDALLALGPEETAIPIVATDTAALVGSVVAQSHALHRNLGKGLASLMKANGRGVNRRRVRVSANALGIKTAATYHLCGAFFAQVPTPEQQSIET